MNSDQSPPTASATLTVRPSVPEDIPSLAPRLRKEDLESVLASGSRSAEASLTNGITYSDLCLTAIDEAGSPVLMFGTVPHPHDATVAHLWFLGSNDLDTYGSALIRECQRYLGIFHRKYPLLSCFVDHRASVRGRWLHSCGFTITGTITGPEGHPFHETIRLRSDQCANRFH
ncbi:hypothetical protein J2X76_001423 [Neorhizobium sp. 2083]|nr:hypothetical protein [Neorhizobium sp. 2083]